MTPSGAGDPVVPIDISSAFNAQPRETTLDVNLSGIQTGGKLSVGKIVFDLARKRVTGMGPVIVGTEGQKSNPLVREVGGIKIGVDATSLIFSMPVLRPPQTRRLTG